MATHAALGYLGLLVVIVAGAALDAQFPSAPFLGITAGAAYMLGRSVGQWEV